MSFQAQVNTFENKDLYPIEKYIIYELFNMIIPGFWFAYDSNDVLYIKNDFTKNEYTCLNIDKKYLIKSDKNYFNMNINKLIKICKNIFNNIFTSETLICIDDEKHNSFDVAYYYVKDSPHIMFYANRLMKCIITGKIYFRYDDNDKEKYVLLNIKKYDLILHVDKFTSDCIVLEKTGETMNGLPILYSKELNKFREPTEHFNEFIEMFGEDVYNDI